VTPGTPSLIGGDDGGCSKDQGANVIYAIHRRGLANVLGPGDSLFTPGVPIWNKANLDEA